MPSGKLLSIKPLTTQDKRAKLNKLFNIGSNDEIKDLKKRIAALEKKAGITNV